MGRRWITEVGVRREFEDGDVECTILLRTDDDSPNNNVPEVSRPNLVPELLKICSLTPDIAGLSLTRLNILDDSMMDGLRDFVIDNPDRRRPLLVVSPTMSGEYLVKVEKLSTLLAGLASVVVIPVGLDTYKMEEVVGERYVAYNGAVNIIFPGREVRGSRVVPTKKLMPDELLAVSVGKREIEILAAVTRRTNSSSYSRHISPEMVNELDLRRRITKWREESAEQGTQSKELGDLWAEYEKLDQEKGEVESRLAKSDDENVSLNLLLDQLQQEKDDAERKLQYELDSKQRNWQAASNKIPSDQDTNAVLANNLIDILGDKLTLEDSLSILEKSFFGKIIVLDSAWKSAKDAKKFRYQQKAFELLLKLPTQYWQAKAEGKTDKDAGSFYGDDFSPWESEGIMDNPRAREERTFEYNKTLMQMTNHLKIGVKPSDAETLRIHFDWDPQEKLIIIGHCGKHLFVPK